MPVDLQALYPRLIHLMLDTVFVVDRDNQIVFVSDACETLLGYQACELIGTSITQYMHPDDLAATRASIMRVMNGQPHYDFCNRYLRKDGSVVHILWAACWSEEAQARIGVARDVTAQRKAEDELRFLAHHDPLTRLANRAMFNERLDTALAAARRHNRRLALLFLDINDFKQINDNHGHSVGDRVLCTLARRLESCVGAAGTVARMGGDEFTVLLPDCPSPEAIATHVQHILAVMAEPLDAEFAGIDAPSCSIGVARFPEDGNDADMLLRHADGHMYRIKRQRAATG
ncbi:sensor domain-containing diguanylate cyclase [Pseudomonas putida]|uniref:sensor domain-containing diguanylate cyclase n=1 Tax=Pseudomonas putida TaxID=303 RepID=UPI000281EF94|nr:sensor domain-containing diguanylate cyclase [Pseudomonas putida]EMR47633.1 PAS/PAC sensor-containing diguanylate cyclase [Pseudomonas putida LS46]PJX12288.1 sensor domain-containing diguanylate cyclase [Pseudomonas putida]TRO38910.1 sensor domain-containing diguanylate cyclase [Pseudomonas putida]ULL07449.1 sensor domain-containing diguanylate cyclase [Pseudomonas putida]